MTTARISSPEARAELRATIPHATGPIIADPDALLYLLAAADQRDQLALDLDEARTELQEYAAEICRLQREVANLRAALAVADDTRAALRADVDRWHRRAAELSRQRAVNRDATLSALDAILSALGA